MSVRQSLLAILDQGPCYGYQLRGEFDRRTGSTWPINVGQVYNTLDRLERDELVRKVEIDHDGQNVYEITDAGTAEVGNWLGSPVVRTPATRDELAVKLAIAVTLPGVDVARVIQVQRASTAEAIRELSRRRDAAAAPLSSEELAALLVLDFEIFTAEADLHWLDHTEARLEHASASGAARPVPLSTELPRRGRPAKQTVR